MRIRNIFTYIFTIVFVFSLIYISACDSGSGITTSPPPPPPPPPTPNPYGEGNGKISFIRTQQTDSNIVIYISNKQLNDSIVWQATPPCDTNIASSVILKAGSYGVRIEGNTFLCNYSVNVEERICKIIDYTNCNGGYIGCNDITGVWLRTADGPCPNCRGLKVEFRNGIGEVIYTPQGCRFHIGDIKWTDFILSNCKMYDLARDSLGGSPEYQLADLIFINKISFTINGPSGIIPYLKIAQKNVKKIYKNINRTVDRTPASDSNGLQVTRGN
jgi:hypothetical protein